MKRILSLLLICITTVLDIKAQTNLIPNPRFEDAKPGKSPQCINGDNNASIDDDISWWKNATCKCSTEKSRPDWHGAGFSCTTNPFANSRHIYIEENRVEDEPKRLQDAVRVGFFSTMQSNKNYIFKISYATGMRKSQSLPSEQFPRVTIHLTRFSEHWNSSWGNTKLWWSMFPPYTFDVNTFPDNGTTNDWAQHWVVLNGPFLNSPPFGNLFNDLKNIVLDCSGNHAYIDYVELVENCESPLLVENHQFYNNIDELPYKSAGTLKAGFDVGNNLLQNGNVIVNSGATATFKAADQIILEPGFVAELGSNFQTIIEPCDINTAREDNTIIVIDDKTIQIGEFFIFDDRVETIGCNDTLNIYGLDGDTTSFISYFWDFGNGETSANPIGSVFYNQPGEYTVKLILTDSLGVTDTLSKIYIVPNCEDSNSRLVSNQNSKTTKKIENLSPTIYPNPTTGNLTISQLEQFAGGNIEITNLLGQTVFSQQINANTLNINLSHQPKGIYLVKISSQKQNVVQKVVLE